MIHVIIIVEVTIVYLEKSVFYLLALPLRWPALDRLHQKTHK